MTSGCTRRSTRARPGGGMTVRFGVFDHIEPVPGQRLDQIYRERLVQIERLDRAGFYAYHLAEHHTPAIPSLAPSQNVFLGSVAQRTTRMRFRPCVYVLPLHHPLRLIEEISMLDNLSGGRLEVGVGRGGVMEAFFWGQEADPETNYARYLETLAIVREGLSHDQLTYAGRFHSFENLPMYLRPLQQPYPPLWYMRNPVTAAMEGMHTIIVGSIDGLAGAGHRRRARALRPGETGIPSQPPRWGGPGRNAAGGAGVHGRVRGDRGQLLRLLVPVGRYQPPGRDAIHRALRDRSDAPLRDARLAGARLNHARPPGGPSPHTQPPSTM